MCPGVWEAFIEKSEVDGWGNRVKQLVVKAKDQSIDLRGLLPIDVGVDSGQAGVFDNKLYKSNMSKPHKLIGNHEYERRSFVHRLECNLDISTSDYGDMLKDFDNEEVEGSVDFYEVCCDKTLGDMGAGVVEYGAVSSSGLGDGSYSAFAGYNSNKEVVEISIIFLGDEDEDGDE